jgi:hypothetical protein
LLDRQISVGAVATKALVQEGDLARTVGLVLGVSAQV